MKFTKMQGCGNDYIYVNGFTEKIPQERKPELVRTLSDRHFGIGGDGVIFINPSNQADFEMEMYNADGSRAEMCGNGIRCVAKFVYDKGLTEKKRISVVSAGQVKYLDLTVEEGRVSRVRVNMGRPELRPERIPVDLDKAWERPEAVGTAQGVSEAQGAGEEQGIGKVQESGEAQGVAELQGTGEEQGAGEARGTGEEQGAGKAQGTGEARGAGEAHGAGEAQAAGAAVNVPILVDGREYRMTCVSMGNPHAVIFAEHVAELDLEKIGPSFEHHKCFPNRTNTEFVEVLDRSRVFMRVWERGTGETLACGTGACATAVACVLNGLTEEKVTVKLLGGELEIEWDRAADLVYMTGPAAVVFEGEI